MTKKINLFVIMMVVLFGVAFMVITTNKEPSYKKGTSTVNDAAVRAAHDVYQKRVSQGVDLSAGPCLTNDLMSGWVVDLVHNPRQAIDDLPENQCQAYIEGRSRHFVELDLDGKLVRVK